MFQLDNFRKHRLVFVLASALLAMWLVGMVYAACANDHGHTMATENSDSCSLLSESVSDTGHCGEAEASCASCASVPQTPVLYSSLTLADKKDSTKNLFNESVSLKVPIRTLVSLLGYSEGIVHNPSLHPSQKYRVLLI